MLNLSWEEGGGKQKKKRKKRPWYLKERQSYYKRKKKKEKGENECCGKAKMKIIAFRHFKKANTFARHTDFNFGLYCHWIDLSTKSRNKGDKKNK